MIGETYLNNEIRNFSEFYFQQILLDYNNCPSLNSYDNYITIHIT